MRERCVMTTWDPDTQKQSPEVFQKIQERFEGTLALNCWVIRGGRIHVNDTVELTEPSQEIPQDAHWGRYASERLRQSLP